MLSDNEHRKTLPSNKRRAIKAATNKHWSDSQKIEAVTTYLTLGNLALTARVLKIPEITLRTWKSKDWWTDIEGELRVQENLQLSERLRKVFDSSLAVVEDRLVNGDFIYDNKTGALLRKPVAMKDAHKVALDMMNKRDILLDRQPKDISVEKIDEKLSKLAAQFEQIAQQRRVVEVTDVIIGEEATDA